MKYLFALCFLAGIATSPAFAQDPTFSQFYNNPIYLNPALSGFASDHMKINIGGRRQLLYENTYLYSSSISGDWNAQRLHGGLSFQLNNQIVSDNVVIYNNVQLAYAYHLSFWKNDSLSFGVQLGWHQNFMDLNKVSPPPGLISEIYHGPNAPLNHWRKIGYFDIGAGVVFSSRNIVGGILVKHINRPQYYFFATPQRLRVLYQSHLGYELKFNNGFSLLPHILLNAQSAYTSYVLAINGRYRSLTLGTGIRSLRGLISSIGITRPHFQLQYTFDYFFNWPYTPDFSSRAHELSFGFLFLELSK